MNLDWLKTFIHSSMINYRSINGTILCPLEHLFYTNGNGYQHSFIDGNFVVGLNTNEYQRIPFHIYYGLVTNRSLAALKEFYFSRQFELDLEHIIQRKKELARLIGGEEDTNFWQEAHDDLINSIETIQDFNSEDLLDPEFIKKMVVERLEHQKVEYRGDKWTKCDRDAIQCRVCDGFPYGWWPVNRDREYQYVPVARLANTAGIREDLFLVASNINHAVQEVYREHAARLPDCEYKKWCEERNDSFDDFVKFFDKVKVLK